MPCRDSRLAPTQALPLLTVAGLQQASLAVADYCKTQAAEVTAQHGMAYGAYDLHAKCVPASRKVVQLGPNWPQKDEKKYTNWKTWMPPGVVKGW